MLRVAWKSVLGNKLRLALTGVAIVIGVAFVSGTFVLTDSIQQAFDGLLTEINAGIDGYVNPSEELEGVPDGPPSGAEAVATVDEDVLDEVLAVDGVATAEGLVQGYAQIIGADGEAIGQTGPPRLGFSWSDEDGSLVLRDGRAPTGPDEVVVDVASARTGDLAVGDDVRIVTIDGATTFTLVGVVGFGEEDNLLGATIAAFTQDRAQELFGLEGRFTQIPFQVDGDRDPDEVVAAVQAALADDTSVAVESAASQQASEQQEITEGLGFLNTALLAFAGVALFVGAFLIVNTFTIIVAQRTREFALLRAVGASAGQVRSAVVVEAVVVGLVSSTLGLLGGIGFAQLLRLVFDAIGFGFPDGGVVVAPRTIVAAYVIGVGITAVAAIAPARRAASVAPVEALRGSGAQDPEVVGRMRTLGGVGFAALGLALLAFGLVGGTSQAAALVGAGAAALFLGVSLLAPYLSLPMATALGVVSRRRGVAGTLARNNARRNPKRTASTASALMIGVALVTFVSVFSSSAIASVDRVFEEQLSADFLLSSESFGPVPLSVAADLRDREEVADVASQRGVGPIRLESGDETNLTGVTLPAMLANADLQELTGDLATLGGGEVFVKEGEAQRRGLAMGDTVTFDTPQVQDVTLTVAGTFRDEGDFASDYLVTTDQWDEVLSGPDSAVFARVADGAEADEARAAIEEVLTAYPGIQVQDQSDLREMVRSQVDQLLNLLIGLLMLAVVIALIGIVNTLALSIFERTREIGLLRAVGMTRPQVRTMIRWEAVIVAVFGAVLGVAVGAFLGWAMVTAVPDLPVLEFPAGRMVVYVVLAGLAGVVAAILPARRAARLDVLEAVTTE